MARQPFFGRGQGPQIARMDMNVATAPGRAYGQMFANLGKIAGDSIEKYAEGKKKKEEQDELIKSTKSFIMGNPELGKMLNIQATDGISYEEAVNQAVPSLVKNPKGFEMIKGIQAMSDQQRKARQDAELFNRKISQFDQSQETAKELKEKTAGFEEFLSEQPQVIDPTGPGRFDVLRNLRGGKGVTPPARMIPGASPAEEMLMSPEAKSFARRAVEGGQPMSLVMPMAQKIDSQIAAQTPKPYSPTELKALRELEKPLLNPGEVEIDKLVGKEYSEFVNMGGQAAVNSKIQKLDDAIVELEKDGDLTGWIKGSLPESLKALFNSKGLSTKEAVESVIQENLRETLGAQFAQKEGEMFMARGYNDKLGDEENAKRVRALLKEIKDRAKARNQSFAYFKENGTMKGYNGPSFETVESQSPDTGGIETSTQGNYKIGDLSVGGYQPGQ